jgi:trans-aconitate 2-methyltransferase
MDMPSTPATPVWDPRQYLNHAGHRTRPFLDLLARIPDPQTAAAAPGAPRAPRIADLGCGAGNVTALLAERWPAARITGLDNSPQMLEKAAAGYGGPTPGGGSMDFRPADLAGWTPAEPYDLIVSNAALQWVPGHGDSLPGWIDSLPPGGVLAFQVPGNGTAPSHRLLAALVESPRWRDRLSGRGEGSGHALEPADYLARLTAAGCTADVWETTYLQVMTGTDPVLDWVKGTALRPVLTALAQDPEATGAFLAEYRDLLREAYPPAPHGTVYPFRRLFAVAVKNTAPQH